MGYACPVCETPQADGRHLANHLAFTAMIHGDDHEAWLTEHAPGWDEAGERELAVRVIESATEIEFPPGEDGERGGRGDTHGHDHHESGHGAHKHERGHPPGGEHGRNRGRSQAENQGLADVTTDFEGRGDSAGGDEPDVAAVLAEARELTRRMGSEENPTRDGEGSGSNREREPGRDEGERSETSEREERNDGQGG